MEEVKAELKKESNPEKVAFVASCPTASGSRIGYVYDIMTLEQAILFSTSYPGYLVGQCRCENDPKVVIVNREGKFKILNK